MFKSENKKFQWKRMSIEDKILTVIEKICYFLTICTLFSIILVVNKGSVASGWILFFSSIALLACGLDARSGRDMHLNEWNFKFKLENKKVNKAVKFN